MKYVCVRTLAVAVALVACKDVTPSSTTIADPPPGAPLKELVVPAQRPTPAAAENAAACSGSGARLSVMPIGDADCQVTVGQTHVGVAPFANKDAPVGKCDIQVICPRGREYKTTRTLRAGVLEKVVLKTRDLQP